MATRHSLLILVTLLLAGGRSPVFAQTAGQVRFSGGAVSVVVENVPAADVLAEWARAGTKIVGLERLAQRRITLNLVDVPEEQALQAIVGPELTFAATSRSLAGTGSRFLQVVILTAMHPSGVTGGNDQSPPEARFSYPTPAHAISTSDVFLTDVLPAAPTGRGSMADPETMYDYTRPQDAKLQDRAREFTAPYANPERAGAAVIPEREPESVFSYSAPRQAQIAAAQNQKTVSPQPKADAAKPHPDVEPETRFSYFVPTKAAPPKKDESDAPDVSSAQGSMPSASPAAVSAPGAGRSSPETPSPNGETPCTAKNHKNKKRTTVKGRTLPPCTAEPQQGSPR